MTKMEDMIPYLGYNNDCFPSIDHTHRNNLFNLINLSTLPPCIILNTNYQIRNLFG